MSKYMTLFTYSSGSWARLINSPGDRVAAARDLVESLGGSLDCIYWLLGTNDGVVIEDLPDSVTAEAVTTAVSKTGAFKSVETHELLTAQQITDALVLARDASQVYKVPGQ